MDGCEVGTRSRYQYTFAGRHRMYKVQQPVFVSMHENDTLYLDIHDFAICSLRYAKLVSLGVFESTCQAFLL